MPTRRRFVQHSLVSAGLAWLPAYSHRLLAQGNEQSMAFGGGEIFSVSDGNLNLPASMLFHESIEQSQREAVITKYGLSTESYTPDCNLTLWRTADKLILFDVGAGYQFSAGGGQLLDSLAALSIDPSEVTDIVFTHGHPDHIWGILDDFDDLTFPEALYHMPQKEWEYWTNANTLDRTPEARKSFVVGAQNRLPLIADQVSLFLPGDEVLPGIEAVDTSGHTPGHCSYVLHDGDSSILIVGDALANATVSFEYPKWPSGSDQDAEQGIKTRLSLLDRASHNGSRILGFHLPAPGVGYVEKMADQSYRFVMA